VTETDVARIESSLGRPLPSGYRTFLLLHSDEVRLIKEKLPYRAVLWTDPDEIIRENQEARTYAAAMTIGEDEKPWPEDYLVVGTNGGGDYWFIDDGSKPGLWFWQHEAHGIEQHAASFDAYMEQLRVEALQPPM
jgi:hypothetical protein